MAAATWADLDVVVIDTPGRDSDGNIDQLGQALIAVGRGEWFGVGLGNSLQKLLYLQQLMSLPFYTIVHHLHLGNTM